MLSPTVRRAAICPSSWRNRRQRYDLPSMGMWSRTRFNLITRGKKTLSTHSATDLFSWWGWGTAFVEQPGLQLPDLQGVNRFRRGYFTALWTSVWFWLLTVFYVNYEVMLIFSVPFAPPQPMTWRAAAHRNSQVSRVCSPWPSHFVSEKLFFRCPHQLFLIVLPYSDRSHSLPLSLGY